MDSAKEKLMKAISRGNYEDVKKLLRTFESRSVLPLTRDKEIYSFLSNAVSLKYPLITKLLLEKFQKLKFPVTVGEPLIFTAIEKQDIETVKILLDQGMDVNCKKSVSNEKNAKSYGVLHSAVKQGNLEIVKLLVNHGADVSMKDEEGNAPVHTAFEGEFLEIIKFLVQRGADINSTNDVYDNTLLHIALKVKSWEMAKFLIENGADVNIKNKHQDGPLFTALYAYDPCMEIVKLLLAKGADVNSQNLLGRHPIHNATRKLETLKHFLEIGADINAQAWDGETPLMFAATLYYSKKEEQLGIIKYLQKNMERNFTWRMRIAMRNLGKREMII